MAGNINNTSVPIRVLCDLPAVITPSTEDKYEYNTQCGWYITPVTPGSRTVYIRNSRRGDVAAYDHLYYNPSTKRVEVTDGQDDDNARWMLITLDEYRRQIFDLRDGNIEVTAFIDDSRFNRNNLWENSWAWQNTAGRLHNIGESEDVVADDGPLIKKGWGLPAIQTWEYPSRGSVGVNYYSQFNVAEIKHTVSNGHDRYLTFRGTFGYDEANPAPKGAYMVAGGNMYHLTADTKLYGFRAYIQETDAEGVPLNAQQSPSRLSMRITDEGGQTTDISTVETDGTAARTVHAPAIYNLTGRAVRLGTTSTDGLPKGIYIVDGRKTVVR